MNLFVLTWCLAIVVVESASAQTASVPRRLSIPDDVAGTVAMQRTALERALARVQTTSLTPAQTNVEITAQVAQLGASLAPPSRVPSLIQADGRYLENFNKLFGVQEPQKQDSNRIWSGMPTRGYNNTVSLHLKGGGLCTGVIVASDAVLTAAHCVCPGNMVSEIHEGYVADSPSNIIHRVLSQKTMRACASDGSTAADIAIIRIQDVFAQDAPAVVASSETVDDSTFVRAVGFGSTSNGSIGVKLYVDIPVASPHCAGSVQIRQGLKQTDQSYYRCFSSFEMVAGQAHLNRDTCHGDSGGPIFFHSDNGHGYDEFLVGITSRGVQAPGAHDCGDGGIYTRIDGPVTKFMQAEGIALKVQ